LCAEFYGCLDTILVPCQHSVEIDIHDAEGQSFADIGFRPQYFTAKINIIFFRSIAFQANISLLD
jgi:hypothetical protein